VIHAADRDLHSGFYGSAAANPNHVLAASSPTCTTPTGRVTIPGFYDGVPELPARCGEWAKLPFTPGFPRPGRPRRPAGEKGRSVFEQTWSRPTCEVNGMGGGYQGSGLQDGDPGAGLVQDLVPPGRRPGPAQGPRRVPRPSCGRGCPPIAGGVHRARLGNGSGLRHPARAFQRARRRSADEWGREAAFVGGGGSIPVATEIKQKLGMDVVMAGFALNDDRIHSPNEKYDLRSSTRASGPGRASSTPGALTPSRSGRRPIRPPPITRAEIVSWSGRQDTGPADCQTDGNRGARARPRVGEKRPPVVPEARLWRDGAAGRWPRGRDRVSVDRAERASWSAIKNGLQPAKYRYINDLIYCAGATAASTFWRSKLRERRLGPMRVL
jgi:hypothetical protein